MNKTSILTGLLLNIKEMLKTHGRKIMSAALITLAGLSLFIGWNDIRGEDTGNLLVPMAEEETERLVGAMIATYGSLRLINAALSAAEEVEVEGGFIITGSIHPMKFMEPVDDTVERVSDTIFLLVVGVVMVTVGLGPVAALGAFALGLGLLGYALQAALNRLPLWYNKWLFPLQKKLLYMGIVLAIVLPLVLAGATTVSELLTQGAHEEATATLKDIAGISDPGNPPSGECPWYNPFCEEQEENENEGCAWYDLLCTDQEEAESNDNGVIDVFWTRADDLLGATLALIGIFLLRAVILPVLFFWLALMLLKHIARAQSGE
ncbi:MAG: hypothetical protein ACR2PR_02410 [Pseudohongiellaceae bacterium]